MANHIYTSEELKQIQQPLDNKTGYSNEKFDKLYPATKNPFHGTERDSKLKKGIGNGRVMGLSSEDYDRIFGKK